MEKDDVAAIGAAADMLAAGLGVEQRGEIALLYRITRALGPGRALHFLEQSADLALAPEEARHLPFDSYIYVVRLRATPEERAAIFGEE